jgi:hypothetical protein
MGAFPEKQLGVGGAVNDTSLELGGSLGIAILGSILASTYSSGLDAAVGGRLPAQAADAAGESVGRALTVAQKIAATAGPGPAATLVRAADHAFAHAVAHTSLVGGVILGVGTVVVALLLPGRHRATPDGETVKDARETVSV